MPDFYQDMGYELPDEVQPIKSEGFEYYQHPVGIYIGLFGKPILKYKDINGKACDSTTEGRKLDHINIPQWILKYLGAESTPVDKPVLSIGADMIHIPAGIAQTAELYFNFMISTDPKWQWSIQQKLESFAIPGHDELRLVTVNPNKMTEKYTNLRALPYYYGAPIQFTLSDIKKDGSKTRAYLATIKLIDGVRPTPEMMNRLETDYQSLLTKEQEARKSNNDNVAPPPPNTDFSDIENEFS